MTKRNTTPYWLLLTGIMLLVSVTMLIRPTRSHYINTTVWNTALYGQTDCPTSNCLVAEGQTILLDKLNLTDENGAAVTSQYPFTLSTAGGTLDWSVSCSDQAAEEYLTVVVTAEENAEGWMDAALELTPVLTVAHPEVTADITVTWTKGADVLSGVFRVTVPEVIIPEEEPEVIPPEGTQEPPEGDGEEQPEAGQEGETPAVFTAPGAVTLNVTAPETYDRTGFLPVDITVEGAVNAIYVGMPQTGEDGSVTMAPLPSFTRYSVDGGKSFTLLYYGGLIELTESGTVLLDLQQTDLDLSAAHTLYVLAFNTDQTQQAEITVAAGDILPQERTVAPRMITATNKEVSIPLPGQWSDGKLNWTISGRNTDGTYSPVEDLTAIGLTVEKIAGESGETLHIRITPQGEQRPAPGTYKLRLDWSWQGAGFAGTELTFFVNYVVDAQEV